MLVIEVGHLDDLIKVEDISDSISIANKDEMLYYSLIGFTIHVGTHFSMRVKLDDGWYTYDGMEISKLNKVNDKIMKILGRINCIIYVLADISRL